MWLAFSAERGVGGGVVEWGGGKVNPISNSLYWATKWDMSCIVGLWLITGLCANDQVDQDVSPLDVSAHFFVRLWLIKLWACGTKSVGLRLSALASCALVTSIRAETTAILTKYLLIWLLCTSQNMRISLTNGTFQFTQTSEVYLTSILMPLNTVMILCGITGQVQNENQIPQISTGSSERLGCI